MSHPQIERPWSVYPTVHLSQHSSILSFPKATIETPLAFSKVPAATPESCYHTITKYSYEEYKKNSDHSIPLDAKSYFAKAYGKKDMFSKEIKVESKITRPVSVNLEETLLQVSSDIKPETSSSPSPKKKASTLGNLFGGFDDPDDDNSSTATAPPLAPQTSSTFHGFDSFESFSQTPHSPATTTAFDAFASNSPSASKPSASFFDSFDTPTASAAFPSFDSSFDSSFPSSAISEPVKPILREYSINQSLVCFEELLCLYKNYVIDKFQLTGSIQYQFSLSPTESSPPPLPPSDSDTNLVASLHINDPAKKLAEMLPHSQTVSLQPGNAVQVTIPWEEKFLTEPSTVVVAKYLASPSFRPEFLRTRMNISVREMPPPDLPSNPPQPYLVIGIQLMLNKNYPQICYENIQVMCSLTSLPEIHGEIKTRPNGIFSQQSKILTWRCGNQSAGKQALLQMEATVPLQQPLSPIPSALPVIVKGFMTDTPIVTDCTFALDSAAVVMKDPTISPSIALTSVTNPSVSYKSKIEYRFL